MTDFSRDVLEIAYHWHAQSVDGVLSLAEHDELTAWLAADPSHKAAFDRADTLWRKLDQVPRGALDSVTGNSTTRFSRELASVGDESRFFSRNSRRLIAVAASLGTIALVSLLVSFESVEIPSTVSYRTNTAESKDVGLPDGTVVNLGPKSHIAVTFTDATRDVSLFSGQVYFDVARDPEVPFVVNMGSFSATVLGTEFVAERNLQSSQIAVSEGRVMVAPISSASRMPARELTRGSRVRVTQAGEVSYSEIDANLIGVWRDGQWVFSDALLSDVISHASRYYAHPIEILDPRIGEKTVTLSLDAGDVETLLDNFALAFQLRIRRQSDGTIVITGGYE